MTIRGEDRANPVVLVLHGGPGDAINPWGYAGFRAWLKSYTVVQWDQRGAGRTLGRNGPASAGSLSIDRLVRDGVELADALRTSLRKDRIVLLGHSWGSVLGVLMAKAKPDLFQAFVGTGHVGDPARGYAAAFDAMLAKARASGDARAALTGRFALPVFVIQGAEDFTTPTSLARAFVADIDAPRKAFFTIGGGHFAAFMNPSGFLKELGALLASAG